MHPQAMRQKHREAAAEASELAASIAEKTGVDASVLNVSHNEPAMKAMLQAEAMRDFLKDLDAALGSGPAATDFESVDGIGPDVAYELRAAGIATLEQLRAASREDLLAIDGIGPAMLKKIEKQL